MALKSEDKDIQFGYLYLPAKYKSLKVIDGQHRLYGCALLDSADQPNLFFVAFEGINGSEEANLFATINKEQQKVQKRLLDELDGELKWDSDDLGERIQAISSRAIDLLNAKFGSPFEDTVVSPGLTSSDERPLTLPEIRKAIISYGLIAQRSTKGNWLPGPFYCSRNGNIDNKETLDRLMDGLAWYFEKISKANEELWERGKEGRICNNFGVPGHIRLLSEMIKHVENRDNLRASELSLKQIFIQISPLLEAVTNFISSASPKQIDRNFNVRLGSGGIKQYYFSLSKIVHNVDSSFRPSGFEQWLSELDKEEQEKADKDAKWIQDFVHTSVVETLRENYGENFFDRAITNKEIQLSALKKRLDDDEMSRGGPEKYLDFLDLRKIVEQKEHWPLFEKSFNIPLPDQRKGLAKYIQWFDEVNRIRRVSAHPYQRVYTDKDLKILNVVTEHLTRPNAN